MTQESKHTPAPWSINDFPQKDSRISIGAIGTPLIAYVPDRDVSVNEQKANARLIASAPELLDALGIAMQFDEKLKEHIRRYEWGARFLDKSHAAIAKARGE